uniref:lipid-binding protein n=1 Tax=Prevotella sp. TaxID=59823 RepID=UPI004027F26A
MKKYISMFMVALVGMFTFVSCDPETDEKAGGTAVEKMAGHWVVTVDAVDEDGNVIDENLLGKKIDLNTYNTAANEADKMWLDDGGNFYNVKMKVNVTDYKNGKFEAIPNTSYNPSDDSAGNVEFLKGQVLYGQGKNLHGAPVDSICYTVKFDDDEDGLIYRVSGKRYSGFTE